MPINYGINSKTMSESVIEIYEKIHKVLSIHCKLNFLAMSATQVLGFNGFKRWHRMRSRELMELKYCLANELFDKFRIAPIFKDYELNYSPADLKEHLESWDKVILNAIEELGTANKEYYEVIGMNSKVIKKALCIFMKDFEKVGRYLKRFTESDWLSLDMHTVDDKLHEKFKCKEEKYGLKYN